MPDVKFDACSENGPTNANAEPTSQTLHQNETLNMEHPTQVVSHDLWRKPRNQTAKAAKEGRERGREGRNWWAPGATPAASRAPRAPHECFLSCAPRRRGNSPAGPRRRRGGRARRRRRRRAASRCACSASATLGRWRRRCWRGARWRASGPRRCRPAPWPQRGGGKRHRTEPHPAAEQTRRSQGPRERYRRSIAATQAAHSSAPGARAMVTVRERAAAVRLAARGGD